MDTWKVLIVVVSGVAVLAVAGCSGPTPSSGGGSAAAATPAGDAGDGGASAASDGAARPGSDGGAVSGDAGTAPVAPPHPSLDESLTDAERFPMHGVALFHHVNIYSEANSRSERVGVLRRGARVRVGRENPGRGCRGGRWHPVEPAGYVCSGRTMRIRDEPPNLGFAPAPPRDEALPYDYGRNRREGVPLYRRIPRASEMQAEREYQAWLIAERAAAAAAAAAGPPDGGVVEPEEEEEEDDEEEEEEDDRSRTGPIVTRLKRGFFVTIERTVMEDGLRWVRTSELNYVDARAIYKRSVAEIQGAELGEGLMLPIGMNQRDTKSRHLAENGRVKGGRVIPAYTVLPLLGTTKMASKTFYSIGDNEIVDAERVTRIDAVDPPPELGPEERWIDVDLREQTLVAYEGDRPVYATLVSTGKPGHATPEGHFRITSKFISTNMADALAEDEPYLIQDVPWTMYFNLAIALHGAFWHSRFGRVRSHGCVNLAPADARWLFHWVGPDLPEAWHGVTSTDRNPGTHVYIHR